MKKLFITGLIILLPLAITIIIIRFFFDLLTTPFVDIVKNFLLLFDHRLADFSQHQTLLLFISRIIVLILLVGLIFFLGFFGHRFFFSYFIKLTERIFSRLPYVKTIYRATVDVTKNILGKTEKIFQQTVLVPFPHKRSAAIGFLTGDAPKEIEQKADFIEKKLKSVFIPTAPHPISGFLLIQSEKDIKKLDITPEDVFKILVSCGLYHPKSEEPFHPDAEKSKT